MKLLEGYVKNRTKEIALTAIFTSLYVATRQFTIVIFPTVFIRPCGFFAYMPVTFLPWTYTWVVPVIVAFTSEEPVGSFFALLAGVQVAYFSSRLLGKHKMLSLLLATYVANFVAVYVRSLMGLIPFFLGVFMGLFKATTTAIACLILAPPVWRLLENMGIIKFSEENRRD